MTNFKNCLALALIAALGISCAHHTRHNEAHTHGSACGHPALLHQGHTDYLHDGHLHHGHAGHADEHALEVSAKNPEACTPSHACATHPAAHTHGATCGHPSVPHSQHTDYLVGGHLHHTHATHCDDHGAVQKAL